MKEALILLSYIFVFFFFCGVFCWGGSGWCWGFFLELGGVFGFFSGFFF